MCACIALGWIHKERCLHFGALQDNVCALLECPPNEHHCDVNSLNRSGEGSDCNTAYCVALHTTRHCTLRTMCMCLYVCNIEGTVCDTAYCATLHAMRHCTLHTMCMCICEYTFEGIVCNTAYCATLHAMRHCTLRTMCMCIYECTFEDTVCDTAYYECP